MNRLSTKKRTLILKLLVEGNSIRGTARITGVSKTTILRLLDIAGRVCAEYQDKAFWDLPCRRLQCDEIWDFIYAKQKNVPSALAPPRKAGDVWTWVVLCADTKLIPVWRVGSRKTKVARKLMEDLEPRLLYRVQMTTDGHAPYLDAVEQAFGGDIDYARIVKNYGCGDSEDFISKYRVEGNPDPAHVSTSFVERHNLTMRMSMRRFIRSANGQSKTRRNHRRMVSLYLMYYNFCRIHQTIGVTPAMEAKVTDTLWEVSDIVGLIDAAETAPGPRGPYNTARKRQLQLEIEQEAQRPRPERIVYMPLGDAAAMTRFAEAHPGLFRAA